MSSLNEIDPRTTKLNSNGLFHEVLVEKRSTPLFGHKGSLFVQVSRDCLGRSMHLHSKSSWKTRHIPHRPFALLGKVGNEAIIAEFAKDV